MALLRFTPSFPIAPVVLASCSVMVAVAPLGAATVEAKRSFDLPRGDAATTLRQFAASAGRSLVFVTDKVRGVATNSVRGEFTPREALDRMLAGSALEAAQDAATGALVVSRKRTAEATPSKGEVGPVSDPQPNPPPKPMSAKPRTLFTVLASWLLASTAAEAQTSTPSAKDEAIVLSPFQVDATADKGYLATQTLSGTRLKTDLKDIGSALTMFTEQMMDDLGASNINDILAFAPNTDAFVNRLANTDGNGNDFINIATQYVTRGGSTSVVGQDFFSNGIPADRFNAEAFTFTRGPNAILFGLGNPAGAFVSSTKRAKPRSGTTVELRTDDRGSFRATVDHNQVIKKGLFALRYAGLYEKNIGFRLPSENFQRRHFLTALLTPSKTTTVRVNYEQGHLKLGAMRPWPAYDGVSAWLAAGSPMLATVGAARPTGISLYSVVGVVSTQFSPGGTGVSPSLKWQGIQGQSTLADYANGFPAASTKRSFVNPAVYPTFASAHGLTSYRLTDFKIYSAFVEQQITKDFFIEAAINQAVTDLALVNGFVGDTDILYMDVNRQLPNGTSNPNAGKLYTEARSSVLIQGPRSLSKRIMASYDFDLTRRSVSWLRHLGRHRTAVFAEEIDNKTYSSNLYVQNTTPLATTGAAASIANGANNVNFRYYYDPANGTVGNYGGQYDTLPILFAHTPLPRPDPSGVTPAYVSAQGPTSRASQIETKALALQSLFWDGRFILTNGLRVDAQRSWLAIPADYATLRDANGIAPDPKNFDVRRFTPNSLSERSGHTYTRGAVLHALPWLSLTYNTSSNFQVNEASRSVFGELLPNPQGKGTDYGLKISLLDRRLFFELTYYQIAARDKIDNVAVTPAGNFKTEIDTIWGAIADFTNDPKYRANPYAELGATTSWSDSATTSSSGWEFAVTANPTKQWRLTLNGSKRSTSQTSARGVNVRRYLADYLPILKANPQWMALSTPNALTVAQRVTRLETTLDNFRAIASLPEDVYAPSWSLNLIESYSFAPASRFSGLSLGGSVNARGRSIDGFAEDAANVLVPTQPYYAPAYEIFGSWISYQRKLFKNRIDWRLQLNVRNLFDAYTVFPLRTVDRRDGTHAGSTAIFRLSEPRTYALTSSFRF